jgi:hypothetical protein
MTSPPAAEVRPAVDAWLRRVEGGEHRRRRDLGRLAVDNDLGFGRIVASEIEAPNMLVNLVLCAWAAVQSHSATEPEQNLDLLDHPRHGHELLHERADAERGRVLLVGRGVGEGLDGLRFRAVQTGRPAAPHRSKMR